MINYSYHSNFENITQLIMSLLSMNVWEKIIDRKDNELTAHLLWLFANCCEDNIELCNLIVKTYLFLNMILPILESDVIFNNILIKGLNFLSLLVKNNNDYTLQYRLLSIIITQYIKNKSTARNVCLNALAHSSFIPHELIHLLFTEIIKEDKISYVYKIINVILDSEKLNDLRIINTIISFLCDSITKPLHSNKIHKEALIVLSNYFGKNYVNTITKVIKDGVFNNIIAIAKEERMSLAKEAIYCIYSGLRCEDIEVVLMLLQNDLCDVCIHLLNRKEKDNEFNELTLDLINLIFELGFEVSDNKAVNYYVNLFRQKEGIELLTLYADSQTEEINHKASFLLSRFFNR